VKLLEADPRVDVAAVMAERRSHEHGCENQKLDAIHREHLVFLLSD
jgi:hypothetical protein